MNETGLGAFMSGIAGGYNAGKQMQRDIKNNQNGLGLSVQQPQQPTVSATGAVGLPQTQPPAAPMASNSTNKAAADGGGAWSTIANLFTPKS